MPKIGKVEATVHRQPNTDWIIKSATILQDGDGKYYASVLFEFDKTVVKVPISDKLLGLDYASDGLYTDSNGKRGSNHKYYKEIHSKLAKEQHKLSRKQGSRKNKKKISQLPETTKKSVLGLKFEYLTVA